MATNITFDVVSVTTNCALVRFYFGIEMEFEMPDQVHSPVEDLVALITLEVELFVDIHVGLKPVLVRERLATQVTENDVLDFQVNCTQVLVFLILFIISSADCC